MFLKIELKCIQRVFFVFNVLGFQ